MGVGGDKIGNTGPLKKKTWAYSFKWKPEQYNTIDFLIETIKDKYGKDTNENNRETQEENTNNKL